MPGAQQWVNDLPNDANKKFVADYRKKYNSRPSFYGAQSYDAAMLINSAVVATDARLTKAQCKRLAVMAQSGLSRAIYPVHTPLDGDVVFAAAMGTKPLPDPVYSLSELGMAAANVLARAIARGVYEAAALPFAGALPSWKDKFARP